MDDREKDFYKFVSEALNNSKPKIVVKAFTMSSIKCGYCSRAINLKDNKFICRCGGEFNGIDRFDHPRHPTLFKREGGRTVSTLNTRTGEWDYEFVETK